MTGRAGFPRRFVTMRLMRLPISRKNEFYKQTVLLYQAELVASLAYDIPVSGKLPCGVSLFHAMAAVAKLGVLLDVVVIPDGKHDSKRRNDKHEGNDDNFIPRIQTPFKLVDYF
jgi:hypothetical protein